MDKPIVSVIIPVYNVELYLEDCLNSVLNQTLSDFEIVCVDDGSTDNSGKICDEYAKIDNRIRVIHKENGGLSSARNEGIKIASGDYIIFLDSDDYLCSTFVIENLANYIINNNYDFVLFKSQKVFPDKKPIDHYGDYDSKIFETSDKLQIFKYMVSQNKQLACSWNKIIKRELFLANHLFFKVGIVGEDIDWIVRLFECSSKISFINEVFHSYRQGVSTSITSAKSEKKLWDLYNTVESVSLSYCKNQDEFSKAVLSFMAYEFAILLFTASNFDNITNFEKFVKLDWLFKYATDKKTKLIKTVYKLLGLKYTIKFLKRVKKYI